LSYRTLEDLAKLTHKVEISFTKHNRLDWRSIMRTISVVGAGYVGLVTAACFAELGHKVTLIEIDPEKMRLLEHGIMPVHEERLPELWQRHWAVGRLRLTSDYEQGLKDSEFVFICVGTPSTSNGKPDLRWVRSAAKSIAQAASGYIVVVSKSTVPVGTAELVHKTIARYKRDNSDFAVVSNPEFLREGCAVLDFLNPIRVVIGSSDVFAAQAVAQLYEPLGSPIILCDAGTAELAKYASNAFLATRISFINEIALLCDKFGVNVVDVAKVVGMEPRCGDGYLGAGLGWGGSCLPKDVRALIYMGQSQGLNSALLRSVLRINLSQPKVAVTKLQRRLSSLRGKTIGILGLAFKPNSDDMREASSLALVSLLQEQGCRIKAYDPTAMEKASALMPKVTYCADAYEVALESDAVVLVTDWDEFKRIDMRKLCSLMNCPVLIDGRNFFDPEEMIDAGFIYEGIGRNASSYGRELLTLLKDKTMEKNLAVSGMKRR
jgi:UDPglucose 6-dehydrogenase